jgi:hypothetical protein
MVEQQALQEKPQVVVEVEVGQPLQEVMFQAQLLEVLVEQEHQIQLQELTHHTLVVVVVEVIHL